MKEPREPNPVGAWESDGGAMPASRGSQRSGTALMSPPPGPPAAARRERQERDRPGFPPDDGFHAEVKRRVFASFSESGISPRDNGAMYLKTALLLLWFAASYALLLLVAATWWQGALLVLSLALAMAGIGFAVQHDANHGAYSERPVVNHILGLTLDMLGASSYVWRHKHNVSHHTYTNLAGSDSDIDLGFVGRLSPAQRRLGIHRAQHVYLWAMYGLLIVKWHLVVDVRSILRGRIAGHRFPRPKGYDLVELCVAKALFLVWVFVVPSLLHPLWAVLLCYAAGSVVLGFVLSVVFQLAHCVEGAAFPEPRAADGRLDDSWAVHQVRTTADFARGNRLLTWYVGGLNFQIEHHLFPRICHVHYPRIAPIVEQMCAEHGITYCAPPTLLGALASHGRWLRRMGRPDAPDAATGRPSRRGRETPAGDRDAATACPGRGDMTS